MRETTVGERELHESKSVCGRHRPPILASMSRRSPTDTVSRLRTAGRTPCQRRATEARVVAQDGTSAGDQAIVPPLPSISAGLPQVHGACARSAHGAG